VKLFTLTNVTEINHLDMIDYYCKVTFDNVAIALIFFLNLIIKMNENRLQILCCHFLFITIRLKMNIRDNK